MLRCLGFAHERLRAEAGLAFAVRRCTVDFRAPTRLDDALTVESRLIELRRASLDLEQRVRRGAVELARLLIQVACIDRRGRAVRLPAELRSALKPLTPEVVTHDAR
jgi:acyl-CoA thioester hydrolase